MHEAIGWFREDGKAKGSSPVVDHLDRKHAHVVKVEEPDNLDANPRSFVRSSTAVQYFSITPSSTVAPWSIILAMEALWTRVHFSRQFP